MSLRLRLALWYGGLAGLLMLAVCAYSYAVHGRAHYDDTDAVLATWAEHVAAELETARTDEEATVVLRSALPLGSAMRIQAVDGTVRRQSASAADAPPVSLAAIAAAAPPPYPLLARLAPALHPASHYKGHGTFGLVNGVERWRVYARGLRDGNYLVAIASLEMIDASVSQFGLLMLLMALVGAAVTFLAGWFVAASALRPVAAVTDTASAIARSREFSRRVPGRFLPAARDELGRLGATFNDMLGSLEQAYAAQQRFVADASHELRAPLTSIHANLELLRTRTDMPPAERERATEEAWREASRLARLVADLLALARADAGMPIRRERVELDRVLMEVMGEARHLRTGQHMEIAMLEPVTITGDADRIKQLLLVLVDNALKYTPRSGRVTVALRRQGRSAEFVVRDTGIGIPAADLERVFERFYRADRARTRDPGGTGLGLSIASWIAAQHGGDVRLESEPGQGTTAIVRLPV